MPKFYESEFFHVNPDNTDTLKDTVFGLPVQRQYNLTSGFSSGDRLFYFRPGPAVTKFSFVSSVNVKYLSWHVIDGTIPTQARFPLLANDVLKVEYGSRINNYIIIYLDASVSSGDYFRVTVGDG